MPKAAAPDGSYTRAQQDTQGQNNLDANQLFMLRQKLAGLGSNFGNSNWDPSVKAGLESQIGTLSTKVKQEQDLKTAQSAGLTSPDLADILMQGAAGAQRRRLLAQSGANGSFLTGPSGGLANASTVLGGG